MATVFINEFHYDNVGGDIGEFVEIAGPAGTDLTNWTLVLYNGNGGAVYMTQDLSGIIPDQSNGFGTVSLEITGIQNGSPDGMALVNAAGDVIQFLSYEGTITATNGPASGMTSTDIGVSESSTTPVGQSLQLTGTGNTSGDFAWAAAQTATSGTVNTGQTLECFVIGTRILTANGDIPVEILDIGDLVITAEGKALPIKWIGRQTIQPDHIVNSLRGHPILFKAGALGDRIPQRDLYVSPDHALLVEGLLINAGALVNGHSILKANLTESFIYYHVQLEQHSLLMAEGVAAESYLPQKEDRSWYDNGAEYAQLYPNDDILTYWPMRYPRVSSKRQLPQFIAKKLMQLVKAEEKATTS